MHILIFTLRLFQSFFCVLCKVIPAHTCTYLHIPQDDTCTRRQCMEPVGPQAEGHSQQLQRPQSTMANCGRFLSCCGLRASSLPWSLPHFSWPQGGRGFCLLLPLPLPLTLFCVVGLRCCQLDIIALGVVADAGRGLLHLRCPADCCASEALAVSSLFGGSRTRTRGVAWLLGLSMSVRLGSSALTALVRRLMLSLLRQPRRRPAQLFEL